MKCYYCKVTQDNFDALSKFHNLKSKLCKAVWIEENGNFGKIKTNTLESCYNHDSFINIESVLIEDANDFLKIASIILIKKKLSK